MTGAAPAPTIGVDLGGTNLRVALVDASGAVLADDDEPTPEDFDELIGSIRTGIEAVDPDRVAAAVGVGAAGLVDREGTVHYAPNLPMLRSAPIGRALGDAVSYPVVVDNDANAAAWGELEHGAARGQRSTRWS